MLNKIRTSLHTTFALIIIPLLVASFALWGIPSFFTGAAGDAVALVGKTKISAQEFNTTFQNQLNQARLQRADGFSIEQARAQGFDRQVLDRLIVARALEQQAKALGLEASDKMVASIVQSDQAFESPATGRFDRATYQGVLARAGFTPPAYEARLRANLTQGLLIGAADQGFAAPDALIDAMLRRQQERRRVAYFPIQPADVDAPPEPSEEELAQYRETHAAQFIRPEYRRLILFTLDPQDFMAEIEVDEDELRDVYDFRIDEYQTPETRTIRLLTYDREDEATAAKARLASGENIETLAVERGLTLDAVTQTNIREEDLIDATVAAAAFAPESPGIVGPVDGAFGWSVVEIVEITPGERREFEEVVDELRAIRAEEIAADRIYDLAGDFEERRDEGGSLAEAAQAMDLSVRVIEEINENGFDRDGAVVENIAPEMLAEAFALDLGQTTDQLLNFGEYGFFALTVDEIIPEETPPLEEIRDSVRAAWRADRLQEMLNARADDIFARLAEGLSLEDAALAVIKRAPISVAIDRREARETFSAQLLDEIFRAPVGEVLRGRARLGDSVVIARLDAIQIPPAPPAQAMAAARAFIDAGIGNELLDAYVQEVLTSLDARVNERAFALVFPENF